MREREGIDDNVDAAWGNLTDFLCDERGYNSAELTEDQANEIGDAANELIKRWKDGDESITEVILQKRLRAYVDMERRLAEHISEHGQQKWRRYMKSMQDSADDGPEEYREGVNERLSDLVPGWEKTRSREEALYLALVMLDQAIEQGANMRAREMLLARGVGATR